MIQQSDCDSKKNYFTDKMKERMSQLHQYPCTFVEAPMGYGKTTIINEAMDTFGGKIIWQKIYDGSTTEFWEGFCSTIIQIDKDCARGLQNIGTLEDSLMKRELMLLLEGIKLSGNTFIILDDYHHIKSMAVDDFLKMFILNMPENLHLIIISRSAFSGNTYEMQLKGIVNYIGIKDLSFSVEDIKAYFRMLDIYIDKEEQEKLYNYSEGWVSALYLCAVNYKVHGSFIFSKDIQELVYQAVYEPMDNELKSFLKSICLFDTFDLEQAQYIWEKYNCQLFLDKLLLSNAFVTKDSITDNYSMHNIFKLCVRQQFDLMQENERHSIWKKTGDAYFKRQEYIHAMACYYEAKDFDGVMKAMDGGDEEGYNLYEYKDLLIKCYCDCPFEIKKRYPNTILFFASEFVTEFRELELFEKACLDFHRTLEENDSLAEDEKSQLLGEYEVLQTFPSFNDLYKMSECNVRAAKWLKKPARFYNTKDSFMFGSPSILYLYYRESGSLLQLVEFIRGQKDYYSQKGQSFRPLLVAEWYYNIGDFVNAEIIVYKSMTIAKESGQADIELAGIFLLARIYIYRGNLSLFMQLINQMEKLVRYEIMNYQAYKLVYNLDLIKTYLYVCLEKTDQVPEWLYHNDYKRYIHFFSISYADIVYGRLLLLNGENQKVINLSEEFLKQATIFPNLMTVIYTQIYRAVAYYRMNKLEECKVSIKNALDMAVSDGLLLPFVENAKGLIPIFDLIGSDNSYPEFIRKVREIYDEYKESIQKITDGLICNTPKLSKREKQIALLAAEGLNNKEIAQAINISPNTVKLELKNIFRKYNINSRKLLNKEMIE